MGKSEKSRFFQDPKMAKKLVGISFRNISEISSLEALKVDKPDDNVNRCHSYPLSSVFFTVFKAICEGGHLLQLQILMASLFYPMAK